MQRYLFVHKDKKDKKDKSDKTNKKDSASEIIIHASNYEAALFKLAKQVIDIKEWKKS